MNEIESGNFGLELEAIGHDLQLQMVLESATDYAIVILDIVGTIVGWNSGAERILGWSKAEALGQSANLIFTPEDRVAGIADQEMRTAREAGRAADDRWHIRHDGVRFWAHGTMMPMRSGESEVVGFLKILRDQTREHQTNEALRRSEEFLRENGERLRHAERLEVIGRLAAGVAHDFNNILQSIIGGLEIIIDELSEPSSAQKLAHVALGSARRGSALTQQLLSYARKQVLQPEWLDVVQHLTSLQNSFLREFSPEIVVQILPRQITQRVFLDPNELHKAILNLCTNSVQSMPRDGIIKVDTEVEQNLGSSSVVISVSDKGGGMDEATLAQACEPFFSTKGPNATGLGLSMVQGFVKQSGGELRILSRVGVGTRAELRFPALDQLQTPHVW